MYLDYHNPPANQDMYNITEFLQNKIDFHRNLFYSKQQQASINSISARSTYSFIYKGMLYTSSNHTNICEKT